MTKRNRTMRLALAIAAGLLAIMSLSSFAGDKGGGRFTLRLVPGSEYKFSSRWLIFPVTIYPQVACWIETPQGEYVDTVYATAKGAKGAWVSAPKAGRPEALPVWFEARKRKEPKADGISGATPSGATERVSSLAGRLPPGRYKAMLEANRSYDYNERYTKANSGVDGQPSLIYECEIEIGAGPATAAFKPIGTGSLDGSVHPGLDGITTALKLFESAEISYEEGVAQ